MNKIDIQLVEALIFAAPEPVDENRIAEIIGNVTPEEILSSIEELNRFYEESERSFSIIKGGGGFRFATRSQFSRWVKRMVLGSGRLRLSHAALETVSMVAYRQPISKAEIESIRGVDVGGVLKMLLERKLVKVAGYGKGPGRPLLYATTSDFLRHFGLDSLDDLPEPDDLSEVDQAGGLFSSMGEEDPSSESEDSS